MKSAEEYHDALQELKLFIFGKPYEAENDPDPWNPACHPDGDAIAERVMDMLSELDITPPDEPGYEPPKDLTDAVYGLLIDRFADEQVEKLKAEGPPEEWGLDAGE